MRYTEENDIKNIPESQAVTASIRCDRSAYSSFTAICKTACFSSGRSLWTGAVGPGLLFLRLWPFFFFVLHLTSRLVALVYNWWSLFVRLACPEKHSEAITSRPLLLHGVAKQTTHAGQTTITISSSHGKSQMVQSSLQVLSGFLARLKNNAEQLNVGARMRLITRQAFRILLARMPPVARLIPAPG